MDADLDLLLIAVYCTVDDLLPVRAANARRRITDAEVITLCIAQAMLDCRSDEQFLAIAARRLAHLFPALPERSAFHKRRLRLGAVIEGLIAEFARHSPGFYDDLVLVDSTPVECARSVETTRRSQLGDAADYGYCASHSRFFWGLRLHLVCTLQGLPVAFALTGAKADERETLLDLLAAEPHLVAARPGQTLIGDKNYFGRDFERELAQQGVQLLRPTRKGERQRPGGSLFKPLRQVIESVNETFKSQLDLEQHRGRTPRGVIARVMQRILALTAVIWHNDRTGQATLRSLTSYDH